MPDVGVGPIGRLHSPSVGILWMSRQQGAIYAPGKARRWRRGWLAETSQFGVCLSPLREEFARNGPET
jgi:hypothetical protein